MSLPSQVDKFNTNVDRVVQLVNGDKNTTVQTDTGVLPSLAKMLNDSQEAINDAVEAQLGLVPMLASSAGAAAIGVAGGGTVQQALEALGTKEPAITAAAPNPATYYWRGDKTWQLLNKAAVGLSNVNNTADANKPVSTAQAAADAAVLDAAKAYADGVGAAANPYKVGDIVQSARAANFVAPAWIPCDGSAYPLGTYPDLEALFGQGGFEGATRLADPVGGGSLASAVAYSPDGVYLVTGNTVTSPYIQFYKRAGDTYTKLSNPATGIPGWGRQTSWTPDGVYVAIAHDSSPYISIYKRAGDTLTKLVNPNVLPTANATGAVFSPDGNYLVVSMGSTSPYTFVYKRAGDAFTRVANLNDLSSGTTGHFAVAWNKDGSLLYVGLAPTAAIAIYSRNGDVFTKLSEVATNGSVVGMALSADGTLLAARVQGGSNVNIFQVVGQVLSKVAAAFDVLIGSGNSVAWSPDGTYLALGSTNSPALGIYRRSGAYFQRLTDPAVVPSSIYDNGLAFSPDGTHLAAGAASLNAGIGLYKASANFLAPSIVSPYKTKSYIKTGK